jgi:hypothetical protein
MHKEDGQDNFFLGMIVFLGWKDVLEICRKKTFCENLKQNIYFFGKNP